MDNQKVEEKPTKPREKRKSTKRHRTVNKNLPSETKY